VISDVISSVLATPTDHHADFENAITWAEQPATGRIAAPAGSTGCGRPQLVIEGLAGQGLLALTLTIARRVAD
jgi:hypothetical protein